MKCILFLFLSVLLMSSAFAEKINANKITLALFETKNNSIINLPKTSPYWPEVDYHILTVDDAGNIYILNLWNNEIMVYDGKGKFLKTIKVKAKMSRDKHRNGYLEVSGDGKKIFVQGYDQFKRTVQFVFDKDGNILKQLSNINDIAWNFPNARLCNEPYFLYRKGRLVYDENLQLIKENYVFGDTEGEYSIKNKVLIKITMNDKKKLWQKNFDGNFGIIGIDANSNVYIHGVLRKGDPDSVYKLNSKGDILAHAPVPDPFPFKTQAEKEEWEMHSSDDYFSFFKLACNGDIYLIHSLDELPQRTFKRWLKGGEYFIYKFEMVAKEKELK